MKIIHIITAFGFGGAEKLLLNTINLQIKEHKVYLIYLKPIDNLVSELSKDVNIVYFPINYFTIKKLKTYFIKINPDIIHTHLGHADIFGLISAKKSNAKIFCTMHNIYFKKNLLDKLIFKVYRYVLLKNINVISISKSVQNHVIDRLKVPKSRAFLLPNAIPYKTYKIKEKKSGKINLLFIGRLEKQKSLDTLLKAIYLLRNKEPSISLELDIVGDGSLKDQLIALANTLQLENTVRFIGSKKNVDDYYQIADIFILPSIWEGFGIVILEAFRSKVSVIASNIEGPSELIKDGYNGLLFKPLDEVELSEKILELITNIEKRKWIARNGYNTFVENYHIDDYVRKLNKIYEDA